MSRAIGAQLADAWGHQVVVDNRPGANGVLACEIVAEAAPDGYTLFMANVGSHGINPALYKKLPYDPVNDFTPVIRVAWTPNVLVVPPSLAVGTLKELAALAKAKPRQLTYGSNGNGSSQHLAGAMFSSAFGIEMIHVPYKGTSPVIVRPDRRQSIAELQQHAAGAAADQRRPAAAACSDKLEALANDAGDSRNRGNPVRIRSDHVLGHPCARKHAATDCKQAQS